MNDEERMPIVFHVFGHKSKQAYRTKSDFDLMVVPHEQSVITAQAVIDVSIFSILLPLA